MTITNQAGTERGRRHEEYEGDSAEGCRHTDAVFWTPSMQQRKVRSQKALVVGKVKIYGIVNAKNLMDLEKECNKILQTFKYCDVEFIGGAGSSTWNYEGLTHWEYYQAYTYYEYTQVTN